MAQGDHDLAAETPCGVRQEHHLKGCAAAGSQCEGQRRAADHKLRKTAQHFGDRNAAPVSLCHHNRICRALRVYRERSEAQRTGSESDLCLHRQGNNTKPARINPTDRHTNSVFSWSEIPLCFLLERGEEGGSLAIAARDSYTQRKNRCRSGLKQLVARSELEQVRLCPSGPKINCTDYV